MRGCGDGGAEAYGAAKGELSSVSFFLTVYLARK